MRVPKGFFTAKMWPRPHQVLPHLNACLLELFHFGYIYIYIIVCDSYSNERHIDKKKMANAGAKWQHLPFKLVILLLWANDCPRGMFQKYFKILFQMISMNTFLVNPNLIYSESIFFCSRIRRQFIESR